MTGSPVHSKHSHQSKGNEVPDPPLVFLWHVWSSSSRLLCSLCSSSASSASSAYHACHAYHVYHAHGVLLCTTYSVLYLSSQNPPSPTPGTPYSVPLGARNGALVRRGALVSGGGRGVCSFGWTGLAESARKTAKSAEWRRTRP